MAEFIKEKNESVVSITVKAKEKKERIEKEEWKCNKLIVISGIGVREYYRKLGYEKDGPYVSKKI